MLPELWEIIFNLSYNKELNVLTQVCKYFNKETTTILTKRRLNYPRATGKHIKHVVPYNIENLDLILKYLYYSGVDLVKGDIIVPNITPSLDIGYQAIFTGDNLIKYYYQWFEPITLDECFDLVKDTVPFGYWDNIFECFYINLAPYIEECQNIKYDLLCNIVKDCHVGYKDHYVLYSTFTCQRRICYKRSRAFRPVFDGGCFDTHIKTYFIILDSDEVKRKYLKDGKIIDSAMPKIIKLFKKELENFYCRLDSDYGANTLLMSID